MLLYGNADGEFKRLFLLTSEGKESKMREIAVILSVEVSNIAAIYQDAYMNDNYETVFIFCDTELAPYEQYNRLKGKLTELFGAR